MKLSTLYVCLIAMLVVSTVSLGEIIEDPCSTGTTVSSSADASGQYPYDEDEEEAWTFVYTTVGGTCTWSGDCEAMAIGETIEWQGWAAAMASADADVDPDHGQSVSNEAYISISGTTWDLDWPDPVYNSSSEYYYAYDGVYAECRCVSVAGVEEGSASTAWCASSAVATPGLRED